MRLFTEYRTEQSRQVDAKVGHWLLIATMCCGLELGAVGASSTDDTAALNQAPTPSAVFPRRTARFRPRAPQNTYEAQLVLARFGISPGSLDGVIGSQTRAAFRAFQDREGLPNTGRLDAITRSRLLLTDPPERTYLVTIDDLARLQPVEPTWLGKSMQQRLDYETILELLAEKGWAYPNLIRQLNPLIDWTKVPAGTRVTIPSVAMPAVLARAALVRIRLSERALQAFDENNGLLAHFPCSIARRIEKRPIGELLVEKIAGYPSYRFDPGIFPESAEARRLGRVLHIPPGPNNPVGTTWIGLNRLGYGIHGSPRPESVGRTESHGCFRLANWNAAYLAQLVRVGTRVIVEP